MRRGAAEVLAIDDFSDSLDEHHDVGRAKKWETFDLCREAFGFEDSVCRREERNIYDFTPDNIGTFDTVFFFGTLYHLRHPLLALDKLSAVCSGSIYVESAICDDYSPYRGLGAGYKDRQMIMEFYPDKQLGDNPTNWWAPTLDCLGHMVRIAGFEDVRCWKLSDNPREIPHCRGFARGTKKTAR